MQKRKTRNETKIYLFHILYSVFFVLLFQKKSLEGLFSFFFALTFLLKMNEEIVFEFPHSNAKVKEKHSTKRQELKNIFLCIHVTKKKKTIFIHFKNCFEFLFLLLNEKPLNTIQ